MVCLSEAEKIASVSKIQFQQKIMEKESLKKMSEIEGSVCGRVIRKDRPSQFFTSRMHCWMLLRRIMYILLVICIHLCLLQMLQILQEPRERQTQIITQPLKLPKQIRLVKLFAVSHYYVRHLWRLCFFRHDSIFAVILAKNDVLAFIMHEWFWNPSQFRCKNFLHIIFWVLGMWNNQKNIKLKFCWGDVCVFPPTV